MSTLPKHIALIPDGNRRWAKQHNLPSLEGHRQGMQRIQELLQHCQKLDIPVFTVWGFSSENWSRQEQEKNYLFTLFTKAVQQFGHDLIKQQVRFHHLGRQDRLPAQLIKTITNLEQKTATFDQHHFNIALDYGGRDEILRAIQKLAATGTNLAHITEDQLSAYLDTAGQPDVDLVIRTSGEQRTSGYLPWQTTYAEYYFSPLYLPDFTPAHLDQALEDYANRQRRFGK